MTDGIGKDPQNTRVHLIGILGAGMSALAKLYLDRGYTVSGSDAQENPRLAALVQRGASIAIGHAPLTVQGVDTVVFSPAVPRDTPDLVAARAQGIPAVSRARALSDLIAGNEVIAVAGSHGKTTTTALLACILEQAGRTPGYMLGADCAALSGGNARWQGRGLFVNESCEAFRALDYWNPAHCILTNIDDEHSEHYGGFAPLKAAFKEVIERIPLGGHILLCAECAAVSALAAGLGDRAETYGFGQGASWRAVVVSETAEQSAFDIWHKDVLLGRVTLPLPGRHNILNATGALAMALKSGVTFAAAVEALARFGGINRRWQRLGAAGGVQVFDDIAHHPAEVAATLAVARKQAGPDGRVLAVFQPQLHSRVTRLADDFSRALSAADEVLVLPIDSAGEGGDAQAGDAVLRAALRAATVRHAQVHSVDDAAAIVRRMAAAGDIVVTMGPDLARRAGPAILAALKAPQPLPAKATVSPHDSQSHDGLRLQSAFEDRVAAQPQALCVIDSDGTWTYEAIDRKATEIAGKLSARGLGRGTLVVLSAEKSANLIALILGVLKAGCAFVPIDPKMVRASLAETLEKVGASLILCDHAGLSVPGSAIPSVELTRFLADETLPDARASTQPAAPISGDLAYAIFTSGSTSTPRLVGVDHRNVCALITYSTGALFDAQDLALTPFIDSISFDASIHQIFATLSLGGTLLIASDLTRLMQSPQFSAVTNLGGTPSVIARLAEVGALPDTLRVISLGGEVIPQKLVTTLQSATRVQKIFNLYGPTETTIFSTVSRLLDRRLADHPAQLPGNNIGHAIEGTVIYIVDDQDRLCPAGTAGEICIAGAGVTRGYLDDPKRSASRFTPDPFGAQADGRLYRTGDLGRLCPDGSIEFLGRMDDQMKISGVRIDPEEIEMHLNACPGIERAAVVAAKEGAQAGQLIAFVVAHEDTDLSEVRRVLGDTLPSVMVPKSIVRVDALPMTQTGKLKRRDLLAQIPAMAVRQDTGVALDGVEKNLVAIWRAALNRPDLTAQDDFFAVGGDSLASMQMILTAEKTFGIRLAAQAVENLTSAADLAVHIRRQMASPKHVPVAMPEQSAEILDKQRAYLAAWKGDGVAQNGFLRSMNMQGTKQGLYWCFQGYQELEALAAAFGPDQPIHGMRSGHLIMSYTPDTVATLAHTYCENMIRLQPTGSFQLGGNCQGATIARATALALRARGREVSQLILMEQASLWPYDQAVGLIFGRDSTHNPFRKHADPEATFRAAYPAHYDLRITEGRHGSFFKPQYVGSLVQMISELMRP